MRNAFAALLVAACLPAFAAGDTAAAGPRQARVQIDMAIVIPPVLEISLLGAPTVVTVSASDVERGEVSVAGPELAVLANDRRGYVLEAALAGPFVGARIEGLAAPMEIGTQGARVLMPSMVGKPRPRPLAVVFRLRLKEGTAPGSYPWPVSLRIRSP